MKALLKRFEKYMLAVTFAEAGEFMSAREFLDVRRRPSKVDRRQIGAEKKRPRPNLHA